MPHYMEMAYATRATEPRRILSLATQPVPFADATNSEDADRFYRYQAESIIERNKDRARWLHHAMQPTGGITDRIA